MIKDCKKKPISDTESCFIDIFKKNLYPSFPDKNVSTYMLIQVYLKVSTGSNYEVFYIVLFHKSV